MTASTVFVTYYNMKMNFIYEIPIPTRELAEK